jgi:hypothetical protein
MGDNFFSATAFARDEDGGVGGRNPADERAQFHDSWMIANEIAFSRRPSDCDREIRPRFHPQKPPVALIRSYLKRETKSCHIPTVGNKRNLVVGNRGRPVMLSYSN